MYNQIKTTNNYLEVLCFEAASTLTHRREETNKYAYILCVCICVCASGENVVLTLSNLCRHHRSSSQTFRSAGRKQHFQKSPVLNNALNRAADLKKNHQTVSRGIENKIIFHCLSVLCVSLLGCLFACLSFF